MVGVGNGCYDVMCCSLVKNGTFADAQNLPLSATSLVAGVVPGLTRRSTLDSISLPDNTSPSPIRRGLKKPSVVTSSEDDDDDNDSTDDDDDDDEHHEGGDSFSMRGARRSLSDQALEAELARLDELAAAKAAKLSKPVALDRKGTMHMAETEVPMLAPVLFNSHDAAKLAQALVECTWKPDISRSMQSLRQNAAQRASLNSLPSSASASSAMVASNSSDTVSSAASYFHRQDSGSWLDALSPATGASASAQELVPNPGPRTTVNIIPNESRSVMRQREAYQRRVRWIGVRSTPTYCRCC